MKKKEDTMLMLDKDQIAARRVPLEDAQISANKATHFHCHYCLKNFTSENIFTKHVCKNRQKALEFVSPTGQSAFVFYNDWMAARKFTKQTGDAFLTSKLFSCFIKFARFIKDSNITNPDRYVRIMVEKNLQPPLWCRNDAYKLYLESYDKNEDPIHEIQNTINFLIKLCNEENVLAPDGSADLAKIVNHLGAQRIINYVRNKSISPWIIFIAESFKRFIRNLDAEHLKNLNTAINIDYWSTKILNNSKIVAEIKIVTSGLNM